MSQPRFWISYEIEKNERVWTQEREISDQKRDTFVLVAERISPFVGCVRVGFRYVISAWKKTFGD